ncbi:hypothetical protein ACGF0K_10290 [Streptomyces sp. NPDC048156]|uniref:hypothetical protein n=1 Tax=Streptomyces sp. NPDC048156 TaxID=3365502 RepID=UPI003724B7ED
MPVPPRRPSSSGRSRAGSSSPPSVQPALSLRTGKRPWTTWRPWSAGLSSSPATALARSIPPTPPLPPIAAIAAIAARRVVGAILARVESRLEGNVDLSREEVSARAVTAAVAIVEALGGGAGL